MKIPGPALHLRPALLAAGYLDSEMQRWRRSGEVEVLRRGAYVEAAQGRLADPATRHALLISAEAQRVAPAAVFSHVSAAILHGLVVWGVPLDKVHVTRARRTGARIGPSVVVHSAPLAAEQVVLLTGLAVTAPARTIVDLARRSSLAAAVVTADAALRGGLVTLAALADALDVAAGWPGVPAARRVVAFADGRSESVGESRSRVVLQLAGLPAPTPQWEPYPGTRVDFGWPDLRAVGEFDGRVKYGRLLRPGQNAGDVVFAEKLREDALRAAGLRVVRWTWRDLADFDPIADRLRQAFAAPP